jgi:hypothetical protein
VLHEVLKVKENEQRREILYMVREMFRVFFLFQMRITIARLVKAGISFTGLQIEILVPSI